MPDDDEGQDPAPEADKPVTHGEIGGLLRDALTDFFGEPGESHGVDDDDNHGVDDDDGSDGTVSFQEIEKVIEDKVAAAVTKLTGSKKPGKTAATKKAAPPRREPETEPEAPRRVDMRRRFWGMR